MPNRILILYGCSDWENFTRESLQNCLNKYGDYIKVIQIWELEHLKYYLQYEDLEITKFIFPLQIYKQKELNDNGILSIFGNSNKTIDEFDNKKKFVEYAKKYNLDSYLPFTYGDYVYLDKTVIVKEPNNCYGCGITINNLTKLNQEILNENIVQEYIYSNVEYAAHLFVKNGKIEISKVFKQTFNLNNNSEYVHGINNHDINMQLIYLDEDYLSVLEKFLIPCKYSGICCVDFKIADDSIKIFEINPRLGASLAAHIDNFSEIIFKMLY